MTVSVGTTGHNEFTMILEDDKIVVQYHDTRIITVDRRSKTVELDNGGWFTVSTTTHMNRSLRRLFEEVDWVPYFAVSNRGGRLQIVSSDPPAHVSLDETRLEVKVGDEGRVEEKEKRGEEQDLTKDMIGNKMLSEAEALIRAYGWVQDEDGSTDTGFCARGALREARREMDKRSCFDSESRESAFRAAWDALNAEVSFEGFRTLSEWNDSPGRTRAEVLELFDHTKRVFWPDK